MINEQSRWWYEEGRKDGREELALEIARLITQREALTYRVRRLEAETLRAQEKTS